MISNSKYYGVIYHVFAAKYEMKFDKPFAVGQVGPLTWTENMESIHSILLPDAYYS